MTLCGRWLTMGMGAEMVGVRRPSLDWWLAGGAGGMLQGAAEAEEAACACDWLWSFR